MINKLVLKPFIHQSNAINNVIYGENGLGNYDRAQLIMSCATGKSLASIWIHEKYIRGLE